MNMPPCKHVWVTCGTCNGSGQTTGIHKRTFAASTQTCGDCHGKGHVSVKRKLQEAAYTARHGLINEPDCPKTV